MSLNNFNNFKAFRERLLCSDIYCITLLFPIPLDEIVLDL